MIGHAAPQSAVLLDTCAVIWLGNRDRMAEEALDAIFAAGRGPGVFVSPVSAWEIGLLSRPEKAGRSVRFLPDAKTWFARMMAGPGIRDAALTPEIAIDASNLPGSLHADPADRLIVATARHLGAPVVTRDRQIIGYSERGYVGVIPC